MGAQPFAVTPGWGGPVTRLNAMGSERILQFAIGFKTKDINGAALNTVANTTTSIDLGPFPGGFIVKQVHLHVIQLFAGGSISAFTVSVGISGATTKFVNAANVFTGQPLGIKNGVAVTPGDGYLGGAATPNTPGKIRVTPTSTTDNLAGLTAGKLYVNVICQLVRLPKA